MNLFTLLSFVILQITLNADCLPFPAGQIVKYRVPTKYFNVTTQEGSTDPLYSFLSQIHYGGSLQPVTLNSNAIMTEDISNKIVTETSTPATTNESPEATNDVTEQQHKDTIKVNVTVDDNESSLHALIEKVVNDEIKQLAQNRLPVKSNEAIKLQSAPLLNVYIIPTDDSIPPPATKEKIRTTTVTASSAVQDEQTESSATSGSMDLDSETILPTNPPAVEIVTMKLETISDDGTTTDNRVKVSDETTTSKAIVAVAEVAAAVTNGLQVDENVNDENSISDSLLSAVGDLLSSILGLDGSKEEKTDENAIDEENGDENNVSSDNESVHNAAASETTVLPTAETFTTTVVFESESEASSDETTGIERGTERTGETSKPLGYEGELNRERESTETTDVVPLNRPSIALSAVHFEDLSEIDSKIENLANAQTNFATEDTLEQVTETISVDSDSEGVKFKPDMLEVISDPSNEKPTIFEGSVNQVINLMKDTNGVRVPLGDSFLIDKHTMKDNVNVLDDVVYGTLKEIESNLGMNQFEMSTDLNGQVSTQHDELIKNFEAEINKSLINKHPYPFVTFLPNSAKAALQSQRRDDVDF